MYNVRDSRGRFAKRENIKNRQVNNNSRYGVRDHKGRFTKRLASYIALDNTERRYYNVRDSKGRFTAIDW